jgi:Domain of Unknown Function (DUF748)
VAQGTTVVGIGTGMQNPGARLIRWLAVPALLVGLYALVGFFVAPRYAASALKDYTHSTLKRESSVGRIDLNPFTLDAKIRDFSLADRDGKPMLGFGRLHVRFGLWASLIRHGYVISVVELDSLKATAIRRADGTVNLLEAIPPTEHDGSPLPRVFVDSLDVRDAEFGLRDHKRSQPLDVLFKPVSFSLKDFSTKRQDNGYGFKAATTRGESLSWNGTFGLEPLASAGAFELRNIKATTVSQVGLDLLPLDITKGEIRINGRYEFAESGPKQTPKLDLRLDLAQIEVKDLGLRARHESEDWVTIPSLLIERTHLDLDAQTIDVGSIKLDRARITAWLDRSGNLNLAKLYSSQAAAAEARPQDRIEKPWRISVPSIVVSSLDATVEDRKPATPVRLHIAPADVSVTNFRFPLAGSIGLEASATVNGNSKLSVAGPVELAPVKASVKVTVEDFDLPMLQPYIDEVSKINLLKGSVDASLDVSYAASSDPRNKDLPLTARGDVAIHAFHTKDKLLGLDFVNWRLLALRSIDFRGAPLALSINEIVASEPYARVVIAADRTTNIGEVLGTKSDGETPAAATTKPVQSTKAASAKPAPAPALPITVKVVRVENGSMNFADFSVKPNFQTGVQSLSGTVRGISGKPGSKATIALAGKVDRYAPVHIDGEMNVLSAETFTDVRLGFRNLELTTFSPYSGKFAGYRVEKGKMSVDFSYHIQNRQLDAKHKLILDQLELGEKVDSPDATGLPVKLAIALLKDSNGVIDLDLPVNGSLDDPKFRIWPLIWKVLGNLVTKAVTAPFKLLGALFGGGESPELISFVPGSAELDTGATGQIDALKKGLSARPGLKLDIPMVSCPAADNAALTAAAWATHVRDLAKTRLAAGKKGSKVVVDDDDIDSLLADQQAYRKMLESAYRQVHGSAPTIPAAEAGSDADESAVRWLESDLRGSVAPPPTALAELAKRRAEAVQRALLDGSGIDPGRIFLVTDRGGDCADPAFVQMKLGLK